MAGDQLRFGRFQGFFAGGTIFVIDLTLASVQA